MKKRKKITLLTFNFIFISMTVFSQSPFLLEGQIVNGGNQKLTLKGFINGQPQIVTQVNLDEEGKFKIEGEVDATDYYQVELSNLQSNYMIIQPNDTIKMYGDANNLFNICNVIGSEATSLMQSYLREFNDFKQLEDSLKQVVQSDQGKMQEVNTFFNEKATLFYQYRMRILQEHMQSPGILFVMNSIDPDKEYELFMQVSESLVNSYKGSPTGVALMNQQQQIKAKNEKDEMLKPGKEAADIALPNPEGVTMNLSDLRGKVVLIDFWASWCGPCRKENPNVVRAYEKYKEKGFTIFSVSLDKEKSRWLQAIEQDKLTWPNHVSDLKGWASVAAQAYGVSGIPFTLLIDQEGKIIATNVRGEELERRLSAIFNN